MAGESAVVAGASAVETEVGLAAQKVQQESVGMWDILKVGLRNGRRFKNE